MPIPSTKLHRPGSCSEQAFCRYTAQNLQSISRGCTRGIIFQNTCVWTKKGSTCLAQTRLAAREAHTLAALRPASSLRPQPRMGVFDGSNKPAHESTAILGHHCLLPTKHHCQVFTSSYPHRYPCTWPTAVCVARPTSATSMRLSYVYVYMTSTPNICQMSSHPSHLLRYLASFSLPSPVPFLKSPTVSKFRPVSLSLS